MRYKTYRVGPKELELTVIPLGKEAASVLPNVNRWRGQLGLNDNLDRHVPTQVPGLAHITKIAAGTDHALALQDDGTIWAWGKNDRGQLGDNTKTDSAYPVKVTNLP